MTQPPQGGRRSEGAQRLVALAAKLGLRDDALDESVYTLAQELTLGELNGTDGQDRQEAIIAEAEQLASGINNGGVADQVDFLLEHNSSTEIEAIIRQCVPRSRPLPFADRTRRPPGR